MKGQEEVKPPNVIISELCEGILLAASACTWMAHAQNSVEQQIAFLPEPVRGVHASAIGPFEQALRHLNDAMEVLGNFASSCDSCSELDVAFTRVAFKRVHELLGLRK